MPYSELMIRPMREELTRIGVEELRTPQQVDDLLGNSKGTVMVVVNSICGCALPARHVRESRKRCNTK